MNTLNYGFLSFTVHQDSTRGLRMANCQLGTVAHMVRKEQEGRTVWQVEPYQFPHWTHARVWDSFDGATAYAAALGYEMLHKGLSNPKL